MGQTACARASASIPAYTAISADRSREPIADVPAALQLVQPLGPQIRPKIPAVSTWSTQHFILNGKDGVYGDVSRISSRFHCGRESGVVGSLAKRGLLKAIGRAFGKPSSSIYFQLAPHGGIRPAPRRRSRLALTLSEREEISRGIAAYQSTRSMARLLGHSPSTVSREISRNGGYDRYRAALADEKAWLRARRPKRCNLANSPRLRQAVARKLRLNWSPSR